MERELKPISTGNPNFRSIIENNNLYIDKTERIHALIASKSIDNIFFLARPRRFGKSLLVDTLENIFSGRKDYFRNLYIYNHYDFRKYPVVHFDFSTIRGTGFRKVKEDLQNLLLETATRFEIPVNSTDADVIFSSIISGLYEREGHVVVLIDEYDFPLLKNARTEEFEDIKIHLADFYAVLKTKQPCLRFCLITGITKFPQVSIFSQLNNLIDISNKPEFVSLCGYTDDEIDYYFQPYINNFFESQGNMSETDRQAFRENIRKYYDGYRFSPYTDVTIYNPVSIGRFFDGGCNFENFWVETGAQSLVNEIVKNNPALFMNSDSFSVPISATSRFEVSRILTSRESNNIYSYLLQTGYLTIKGIDGGRYILDYPNLEVKNTMETVLLNDVYGLDIYSDDLTALRLYFMQEDTASLISTIKHLYVGFPYDMGLEKERGYQIAFAATLKTLGFEKVETEEKTNNGRIDISVHVKANLYYIIELKLDETAEDAIEQIKKKKYFEKYEKKGNTIHLVGINFSSKERNISDWKEKVVLL